MLDGQRRKPRIGHQICSGFAIHQPLFEYSPMPVGEYAEKSWIQCL